MFAYGSVERGNGKGGLQGNGSADSGCSVRRAGPLAPLAAPAPAGPVATYPATVRRQAGRPAALAPSPLLSSPPTLSPLSTLPLFLSLPPPSRLSGNQVGRQTAPTPGGRGAPGPDSSLSGNRPAVSRSRPEGREASPPASDIWQPGGWAAIEGAVARAEPLGVRLPGNRRRHQTPRAV